LNTRSKTSRSDGRRLQILAGASGVIRKLGLRGAGMRQIAESVGLSPGNLYYYFRNKQELVYFCQDATLDRLLEVARDARRAATAREQLGALIEGHLDALLGERGVGAVHLELDGLQPALYRKLVQKRDRYEQAVRALIADAQKRGEVRIVDTKLAAFALLGALNWTARWFRPDGAYPVATVASEFAQQLLDGLLTAHEARRHA
jgi:AcrR family transcriptional regulator